MVRFGSSACAGLAFVAAVSSVVVVSGAGPAAATPSTSCRPAVVDLGDPLGGGFSYADAVDPAGTIIAGTADLPDGSGRAVMWKAGRAVNLGVVGKYDESFAHGVSDDGTVVGELDFQQTEVAPFIYSHGRMRQLPGLGGDFGYALKINSHGVIVGTASDTAGNPHAVVWTNHGAPSTTSVSRPATFPATPPVSTTATPRWATATTSMRTNDPLCSRAEV